MIELDKQTHNENETDITYMTIPMFDNMPDQFFPFFLDQIKKGKVVIVLNCPPQLM